MIEIKTSFETLPFKEPVPVRGAILNENRFLKVTLLEVDYYLSVLPYFHNTGLEELAFKVKKFFASYNFNTNHIDFSRRFFNLVEVDDFLNSINNEVLFNIECLLLGMLKKTHSHLFDNNEFQQNELYRSRRGPSAYINSKCLKIKIAPTSIDKTIRLLNELHSLNQELIFRLDGNRLFELNDFVEFTKSLENNIPEAAFNKIDYIEEPFKNFSDTYLFQKRSPIKIAMDESFSTLYTLSTEDFPEDIPVVAKPSLFGVSCIYNWMETHTKNRIILSTSFEHPTVKIGLDFLAQKRPSEFHGLENFL